MNNDTSMQKVSPEIYEYAAILVKNGKSREEVKMALESKGLNSEHAGVVAENIFKIRSHSYRKSGRKNMIFGALWCIGGFVVTAMTYSMAANSPTGGTYVVAWGAMVFGAVQFFIGVFEMAKSQPEDTIVPETSANELNLSNSSGENTSIPETQSEQKEELRTEKNLSVLRNEDVSTVNKTANMTKMITPTIYKMGSTFIECPVCGSRFSQSFSGKCANCTFDFSAATAEEI